MNRKLSILFISFVIVANSFGQFVGKITDPVEWINPLMGTDSKPDLSNGNTYPTIALPWGMNFWTPQTGRMGDGWAYTYKADKINGFKQTHQPSPWMNDHGQFAVMPVTGSLKFKLSDRASWFSHKAEIVKPYYYSVYLADYDVTTEIAPTERAAQFRFTFPKSDSSFMVVDAFDKGSYIKIIPSEKKIIGYTTKNSGGVAENFKNYFVIYFDKPFTVAHAWHGNLLAKDTLEYQADHTGAIVQFKTTRLEKINMKVASSFISFEQADINLEREIGDNSFEQTMNKGKISWNNVLGKIMVEGGSMDQVRTFYSCLYRAVFFPQKMYEIDRAGKPIHYSPYNGKIVPGYLFSGTGFWDTFRALYPFLNLVYPDINREMQEGLVNAYKEGGFLPEWSSPAYRNVMIGNNSASVVADAYIKGLRGYDINTLYEALLKDANTEGPLDAVARKGVSYYNSQGYVPYIEVPAGTGQYAWIDYNADGVQQLNEFELAAFPDQAKFIRILTPTNEFIKANYITFNYNLTLNPRAVLNKADLTGIKRFISKLNFITSLQTSKKSIAKGSFEFDPFRYSVNDTDLVTLSTVFLNTISFNRFNSTWGIDLSNLRNNGKSLLTYGYESRSIRDWTAKFRWNFNRSIAFLLNGRKGKNSLFTPSAQFDNRNYDLDIASVEPMLTFIRGTSLRVATSYKYENKKNVPVYGGEKANSHSINLESKYNVLQNSSVTGKFTYNNIDFESKAGTATTTVSYIMLDGLLPGKNYLWSVILTKRLLNNLELNFQYDGRKPATTKTVHIGRASLTALF